MNDKELNKIVEDTTGRSYSIVKRPIQDELKPDTPILKFLIDSFKNINPFKKGLYVLEEPKAPSFFSEGQIRAISYALAPFTAVAAGCATSSVGRPVITEPQQRMVYTDVNSMENTELIKKAGSVDPNATEQVAFEIFSKVYPNLVQEYKPLIYTIEGTSAPTNLDAKIQAFQESAITSCLNISGGRLLNESELIKYGMNEKQAKELLNQLQSAMKNNAKMDEIIGASSYRGGVIAYVGKIEGEHAFVAIPYAPKGFLGNAFAKSAYNILENQLKGKHYSQVPLHGFNQKGSQAGEIQIYSFTDSNFLTYLKLDPHNSYYKIQAVSITGKELDNIVNTKDQKDLSHFTARSGITGKILDWILNDDLLLNYPSNAEFKAPFKEFGRDDLTYVLSGAGPNKVRYAAIIPGSDGEPSALGIFDIHGKNITLSPPPDLLTIAQPNYETKAVLTKIGNVAAVAGLIYLGYSLNHGHIRHLQGISGGQNGGGQIYGTPDGMGGGISGGGMLGGQ